MIDPARHPFRNAGAPVPDEEMSRVIRSAAAGESEALAALVERFTPALLMQADLRLGPALRRLVDPLDIVNDVWMTAFRSLSEFRAEPGRTTVALLGYMSLAILRRVQELHRKHLAGKPLRTAFWSAGNELASGLSELPASVTGVVTNALREERRDVLRRAIASLDDLDRAVVVARSIEGQENDDVALLTGLTPNNVSQRHRRALHKLRELLPASVFDDLSVD